MIGALGKVVFSVSRETIKTFDNLTRSNAGRWATHEIISQKPRTERIGPGLDTISFSMQFDVSMGVNPRREMDALVVMEREGKPHALTLGGKGLGTGLWIIKSQNQSFGRIDNRGNLLSGKVDLSLEEYVVRKK